MNKKPLIKTTDRYAFWTYDQHPFVLGGKIDPDREAGIGWPGQGFVFIPSYQRWFKPFLILSGIEGARLLADLEGMRAAHREAEQELMRRSKVALNLRLREVRARHPNPFIRHACRARAQRVWEATRENGDRP